MEPFLHRLQDYRKGALGEEAANELLRDISNNEGLREAFDREQHFNQFLRSRLQRQPASLTLAQNIRRRVATERPADESTPPHLV